MNHVVAFNGHVAALKDRPLTVTAGERLRLNFHNVGPNDCASTSSERSST